VTPFTKIPVVTRYLSAARCFFMVAKMNLNLDARIGILAEAQTNLKILYLELVRLRYQVRQAQLSAETQRPTRAPKPAPIASMAAT
jgi:hypothetical protein